MSKCNCQMPWTSFFTTLFLIFWWIPHIFWSQNCTGTIERFVWILKVTQIWIWWWRFCRIVIFCLMFLWWVCVVCWCCMVGFVQPLAWTLNFVFETSHFWKFHYIFSNWVESTAFLTIFKSIRRSFGVNLTTTTSSCTKWVLFFGVVLLGAWLCVSKTQYLTDCWCLCYNEWYI